MLIRPEKFRVTSYKRSHFSRQFLSEVLIKLKYVKLEFYNQFGQQSIALSCGKMSEKNQYASAGFSTIAHSKLKRLSAESGKKINVILEDAINTIYDSVMPFFIKKCAETGDFVDYRLTVTPFIKADMISGSFTCSMLEDERVTEATRDLLIEQQFKALDATKQKRAKEFASHD